MHIFVRPFLSDSSRYYSSSKPRSEKFGSDSKESIRRQLKSPQKKPGKITERSPAKPASLPLKWTTEEKALFDQGLAKFGRRWTRIAKMVGSRTVLQVKSYARHYCKNKLQSEETGKEEIINYRNTHPLVKGNQESTWASTKVLGPADPNLNAVKIETLSDDEEVDITDEADYLLPGTPSQTDQLSSPNISPKVITPREYDPGFIERDNRTMASQDCLLLPELSVMSAFEIPKNMFCTEGMNSINYGDSVAHTIQPLQGVSSPSSQTSDLLLHQEGTDPFGDDILLLPSCQLEEEEELKPPDQEVEIDREAIMEEEKQAISEFFEGRPSKTPDRYLKIRNFILAQWEKCKPKYLNKTSVRPGLKNCGDVNCIGRVHTYLELIGAINFGCEQCVYNRPKPADRAKSKEAEDGMEAYQLAQRLQSMRTRRRRVRDSWGNWRDAKELEGQTFEHLSAEELASRYDEEKRKSAKSSKVPRQVKSSFDPFQLIPCRSFNEDKQEPFQVKITAEALLIMDLHAHVSMAEVIGLLGGRYSENENIVEICAAEPCNSLSTGLQCEMDPVSQTQASETLAVRGYSIIGWYHSHPAFDPNPSIRDIDTQAKYQSYFSRGGAMFIGMIISPYNRNNPLPFSQITCLVISDDISPDGSYRLPYKFEVQPMLEEPQYQLVLEKTKWIIDKYRSSHSRVPTNKIFHRDSGLTCLQKLLACLRKTLDKVTNCFAAEEFLTQIEQLFLTQYKSNEESEITEYC
ncbi:deubiquitinase MYSM1 isoform X2 [Ambystoma mexicanum]|uniref:deubiquitinase MYSM1 isoform X2 n=1 Tax=Ambystoma mexicanum TaxID=8296 RepID=UPI0037E80E56